MSHTKGSWYCVESDGNVEIYTDGNDPRLGYTGWMGLAVVSGSDDDPEIGLEVAWDNARLIAAAPELLEACATFLEWLDREDQGFPDVAARGTPEGEERWRAWYDENLRLCALSQSRARAATEKATKP